MNYKINVLFIVFLHLGIVNADVVNSIDANGLTSLMIESKNGNFNGVKYLVEEEGADLNIQAGKKARLKRKMRRNKNCSGWTALMFAISQKHRDIAEYLVEKGAKPFIGDGKGTSAYTMAYDMPGLKEFIDESISSSSISLEKSVSSDELREFESYIENELSGEELSSLLLKSVMNGELDKVKLILKVKEIDFDINPLSFTLNKVKINHKDDLGNSLLILAVLQDDKKILDVLLQANANPFIVCPNGKTPREIALENDLGDFAGSLSIMENVFVQKNDIDGEALSYLFLKAARENNFELLFVILNNKKIDLSLDDQFESNKVKINLADETENTPLMWAVLNNNEVIVSSLLERGANPALQRPGDGLDAYGIAIINNFSDIATLIGNYIDESQL